MRPPQDALNAIIGFGILVGMIQCFFGYRIFKFVLGLTGFLVGGALAGAVGFNISQQAIVGIFAGLLGGILGAFLMVALYFVGIFLFGAFLGGVIGSVLFGMAGSIPEPVAIVILAMIAGVIALIFQKFMIIISTGFNGAWNMVTGIAYFTTGAVEPSNFEKVFKPGETALYMIALCWVLLGIMGVIVQYKSTPKNATKT